MRKTTLTDEMKKITGRLRPIPDPKVMQAIKENLARLKQPPQSDGDV